MTRRASHGTRSPAVRRTLGAVGSLLVAIAVSACPSSEPPVGSPSAATGSAAPATAEVPAEGSAAAAPAVLANPEGRDDGTPLAVPPPLPELMARLGYHDATEVALAEFVPVPPGATGEAGAFGRGESTVRVALVRYANARFAGPHVRDLEERRMVLPQSGEAVLHAGRFVVHIEALDRATADGVASQLRTALRWPPAD
jgi:hypothetical protein